MDFKFEQDSYKFVAFLATLALVGFIYTCVSKVRSGTPQQVDTCMDLVNFQMLLSSSSVTDIIFDALDLITIVVPPALPAAMTIGSVYAQKRLKRKGIFCISPRTINVSGSVDCICFDKTGKA